MKIGDDIICINNFRTPFVKNKKYKITGMTRNDYIVDEYCFSIIPTGHCYNFDEFFISIKKQRKQKLNKIYSL